MLPTALTTNLPTSAELKEMEKALGGLRDFVSRVELIADHLNRFDARISGAPLMGQTADKAPKPVPSGLVGCFNESLSELERHISSLANSIDHLDTIA